MKIKTFLRYQQNCFLLHFFEFFSVEKLLCNFFAHFVKGNCESLLFGVIIFKNLLSICYSHSNFRGKEENTFKNDDQVFFTKLTKRKLQQTTFKLDDSHRKQKSRTIIFQKQKRFTKLKHLVKQIFLDFYEILSNFREYLHKTSRVYVFSYFCVFNYLKFLSIQTGFLGRIINLFRNWYTHDVICEHSPIFRLPRMFLVKTKCFKSKAHQIFAIIMFFIIFKQSHLKTTQTF